MFRAHLDHIYDAFKKIHDFAPFISIDKLSNLKRAVGAIRQESDCLMKSFGVNV